MATQTKKLKATSYLFSSNKSKVTSWKYINIYLNTLKYSQILFNPMCLYEYLLFIHNNNNRMVPFYQLHTEIGFLQKNAYFGLLR